MPLAPNAIPWQVIKGPDGEPTFRHEYKTGIFTSDDGTEQRRAYRSAARQSLRYSITTCKEHFFIPRAQAFARAGKPIGLPDYSRRTKFATPLAINATVGVLERQPAWAIVGETIVIQHGVFAEYHTIDAVSGATITISPDSTRNWDADAIVMPVYPATIELPYKFRRDGFIGRGDLSFEFPPQYMPPPPLGTPGTLFDGKELFLRKPRAGDPFQGEYDATLDRLDFETGIYEYRRRVAYPFERLRFDHYSCSIDEAEDIEAFFHRHKGALKTFRMPTYGRDLEPISSTAAGGSVIHVYGAPNISSLSEVVKAYNGNPMYDVLAIIRTDGTHEYHTVTSVSGSGSVFIGEPLVRQIVPSEIKSISWMPLWRFDSDALEVSFNKNGSTRMSFSMRSVLG